MGFIQTPQKKRIRIRLQNTERLRRAREEHQAWLKSKGLDIKRKPRPPETLEFPKIKDRQGVPLGNKIPVIEKGIGLKKEPMVYSGERKLLGIGTMHKSNMVPVFSEDDAKDLSTMRR
jgi:hypothetical protein